MSKIAEARKITHAKITTFTVVGCLLELSGTDMDGSFVFTTAGVLAACCRFSRVSHSSSWSMDDTLAQRQFSFVVQTEQRGVGPFHHVIYPS